MSLWFSQIPSWGAFVLIVAIANAVAIGVMFLVRHWSRGLGVTSGSPVVNSWATSAGALTALLFAFTIVTVWNSSTRADSNMEREATAIRSVSRDIARAQLPLLSAYVSQTLAEWPQLCGGRPSPGAEASLIRLERFAQPRKTAYADDLYRQLAAMEDMRSRRWQFAASSIPDEIWVALVVLSCSLLMVLAMAMPDRGEIHLLLMIAVATALGTLFWVASLLEYPFCGSTGITPGDILTIAHAHLM